MHTLPPAHPPATRQLVKRRDLALLSVQNSAGLVASFLPEGGLFSLRHGHTLINQVLAGPGEDGFTRLYLRVIALDGTRRSVRLEGPLSGARLVATGPRSVCWRGDFAGVSFLTHFELDADRSAWRWRVELSTTSLEAVIAEVFLAQDIGLADEGAVRNNEAYVSQYIDHLAVHDPHLGPVLLCRQNQAQSGGARPWLALGCASGAVAYSTDGWQFYGADHRVTQHPAALERDALPSTRLQYEFACPALQSRPALLAAGRPVVVEFFAVFEADHPAASSPADLARVRPGPSVPAPTPPANAGLVVAPSLFQNAAWLCGEKLADSALAALFPGPWSHVERVDAAVHSFFTADGFHVATLAKETAIERPHGHILRSGESLWPDNNTLGTTAFAAGVFNAQVFLGNTNLARFLGVVRNHLGIARAGGQRLFVRLGGEWRQLGVPSAFAMATNTARWIYRLENGGVITVETSCARDLPAVRLAVATEGLGEMEFLLTHQLALGGNEFDDGGDLAIHPARGLLVARPSADSLVARRQPGLRFAVIAGDPAAVAAIGGDELLHADDATRNGHFAVLRTRPVAGFVCHLAGAHDGASLDLAVDRLRATADRADAAEFPRHSPALPAAFRLRHAASGIHRIDTVYPWFSHNAMIHFSTPHGLEQYGGAAWGTRDVCQGPVEWLLAHQDHAETRRVLLAVFAQQYPDTGAWPQWFMHAPYHEIQQNHSHGDICFWPIKALCDYLEASGDFALLGEAAPFTDPRTFARTAHAESVLHHVDLVVAHYESRLLPGTALVNYGDGDWDDTLQPADPRLRTHLVSAWTVALAYHTFRQLHEVFVRAGQPARAAKLAGLLAAARRDFADLLMPDGVVAGFALREGDSLRPMLHPRDRDTGIRYRLLPMTRSVLAHLFTPEEAARHFKIIDEHLLFPDGAHLMSECVPYRGGVETTFKRAESAANFGREIGLQYTHAHIRYIEALAVLGRPAALWRALQVINPVDLRASLPNAAARQSNAYFSSSDADFADRDEAGRRYTELKEGVIAVRGGWRIYSSGPALYLNKIVCRLLGLRARYEDLVFDPVLPPELDGLEVSWHWRGQPVLVRYRVGGAGFAPVRATLNGHALPVDRREENPYRAGGLLIAQSLFGEWLQPADNVLEIEV